MATAASGAVARIGSIRLRHSGLSDLVYLPDGKTILSAGRTGCCAGGIGPAANRSDRHLQGAGGPGYCQTLSPDGKWMAAQDGQALVFWKSPRARS